MRRLPAVRVIACTALTVGVAAPVLRRRLSLPRALVLAAAASAPVAARVVLPASRPRDAAVVVLQMWAYLAAYEMPNDDPAALERRVLVSYPATFDRIVGLGVIPTIRLQRALGRPRVLRRFDKALVWTHWLWFSFPHGTALYVLLRHPKRFSGEAALIYATFDLGLIGYWAIPTAPPWYAARVGALGAGTGSDVRRIMVEYGQEFWGNRWERLYGLLGGNPLAAMPSLHFATSVSAAHVLARRGRVQGTVGWAYAGTLGFALVYLGEHYVADLVAGLALAEGVGLAAPRVAPSLRRLNHELGRLEAAAAS